MFESYNIKTQILLPSRKRKLKLRDSHELIWRFMVLPEIYIPNANVYHLTIYSRHIEYVTHSIILQCSYFRENVPVRQ